MSDVAVVTGAGRGLGTAIAHALQRAGFQVLVTDVDEAAAMSVSATIEGSAYAALDVREQAGFERVRDLALSRWGSAAVLVNNAVVTVVRPVLDITPDEFDAVLAVNLRGTFIGCQVFGRHFKGQSYGRIVNVASLAGQNGGSATGAHYAASKGAILTLTKVFARDLAPFGITVNAVAPGPLDLPSVHELLPPDRLAAVVANIPAGTLGDPVFVADTVARLAGRDAGFVTGAAWDINGGLFMR